MAEHVPYLQLMADQREQIHAWLTDHRINYTRVPVYAQFAYDSATQEWRIPIYWHDSNGRMRIDLDGHGLELVRQHVVRRRELRPLPWPEVGAA
ncbi:hypothetical protein GCM10010109_69490 [Actinoplanes campanulatus]|nr:hypothetical protein GCM10010109_69490 [Actinoplanes campanulatus]GID40654.1 hypothetical protein Aca09nite_71600 [Actinoplanes campanulatus]